MCPSVVDIVPTRDVLGAHGYAPLNQAHARLATRVFTILIADYLTRPDAYLGDAARSVTPRRQVFAASCPHALPAI
jgi:hypothetical protein